MHEIDSILKHKPIFVELIGPAGAGKTSLLNNLIKSNENVVKASKPSYRDGKGFQFFIRNAIPLLPIIIRHAPNSEWLNRRQVYWLLFLNGWHHLLEQQTPNNHVLSLFDHGPIYMLASLLEFGPDVSQSQDFWNWWRKKIKEWSTFLDMVIWLDSPDPILAERIKNRESWHVAKDEPDQVIFDFLDRYRESFEQVISISRSHKNAFDVLKIQSDKDAPEQVCDQVMRALQEYPRYNL